MATTKLQTTLTALVVVGAVTTMVIQHRSQLGAREENAALRAQLAQLSNQNEALSNRLGRATNGRVPRLPAPRIAGIASAALPPETLAATNLYALITNKTAKLSLAQVDSYLQANHRNAASLLAGFRTTGDAALLEEAMQKYPQDPQVNFEAVLRKDLAAGERRQWLDNFKQSAPENALANYLSAADYFKAGQSDQAVQEMIAASRKAHFQDYSLERGQDDEEAYRAAGYSVAESKVVASAQLLLPHLIEMRQLGRNLIELSAAYAQGADAASAQAALQMGLTLGQRYSSGANGESLISQLVGIAIERNVLGKMEPNSPCGPDGQTVQDRLNQLAAQKAAFSALTKQVDPLMQTMSAEDWISYNSRSAMFGESAAMHWVLSKYAPK